MAVEECSKRRRLRAGGGGGAGACAAAPAAARQNAPHAPCAVAPGAPASPILSTDQLTLLLMIGAGRWLGNGSDGKRRDWRMPRLAELWTFKACAASAETAPCFQPPTARPRSWQARRLRLRCWGCFARPVAIQITAIDTAAPSDLFEGG